MSTKTVESTEATEKNKKDKIEGIEQTVAKNNVRNNINRQVEEYISAFKKLPKTMNVASLSAREWLFEYGLLNHIKHSKILSKSPELNFISAEMKKDVAIASYINMPENATVLYGKFSDIFNSPYKTSPSGYSYLTDNPKDKKNKTYDLIWADYCTHATTALLNDFKYVVENNIKRGLIYLTFCLSSRRGADKKSLKDLKKYSKANNIAQMTIDAIEVFAKRIKGKKITKVYEVIYGGGANAGTTMITVGFAVDVPQNTITPIIFNDSEWKTANRQKRQQVVYARLRNKGGWTVKKKGRKLNKYKPNEKTIAKRKQTEQEKKAWAKIKKKINIRADRGWNTDKIYSDLENILKKMGKTKQSVSSVLAWRSPKLAKKVK